MREDPRLTLRHARGQETVQRVQRIRCAAGMRLVIRAAACVAAMAVSPAQGPSVVDRRMAAQLLPSCLSWPRRHREGRGSEVPSCRRRMARHNTVAERGVQNDVAHVLPFLDLGGQGGELGLGSRERIVRCPVGMEGV